MTSIQSRPAIRGNWLASAAAVGWLIAALAGPASAATIEFADGDFNLGDYSVTDYAQPGYDTIYNQNGEILGSDFNTFFSYGYGRTGANPAGNRVQAFNAGFVYDPQAQGAILTLDASLDQRDILLYNNQPVSLANAQATLRLLAMQDGNIYRATTLTGLIGAQGIWYATAASGLTASNFLLFDPANPNAPLGAAGLDFGGSAITFGFELAPAGVVFTSGEPVTGRSSAAWQADNFRLTLSTSNVAAGVPEPSAWALLILGFGLVGSGMRRRGERPAARLT